MDVLCEVKAAITCEHYPNTEAVNMQSTMEILNTINR